MVFSGHSAAGTGNLTGIAVAVIAYANILTAVFTLIVLFSGHSAAGTGNLTGIAVAVIAYAKIIATVFTLFMVFSGHSAAGTGNLTGIAVAVIAYANILTAVFTLIVLFTGHSAAGTGNLTGIAVAVIAYAKIIATVFTLFMVFSGHSAAGTNYFSRATIITFFAFIIGRNISIQVRSIKDFVTLGTIEMQISFFAFAICFSIAHFVGMYIRDRIVRTGATLTRATGITISTGIATGVHGKIGSTHLTIEQTNATLMTSFTILASVIRVIFITASGTLYVALAAFNAHLAFGAEIVFMYRVSARKAKFFILADWRYFA